MSPPADQMPEFLSRGGVIGTLIWAFDWADTAAGPIAGWPPGLTALVGLILNSPAPIVIMWGEDGTMIYNAAYAEFAGGRHPHLLGSPVRTGWPEIADFSDHVLQVGLAGGTLAYQDKEFTLYRHGVAEQVWMTLDCSPIADESGQVSGVIAIIRETTPRVLADRDASLVDLNAALERRIEFHTQQVLARDLLIRTFFDHSPGCHAVFFIDSAGRFRVEEANPATLALYRRSRAQVIGRTLEDIVGGAAAAEVNTYLAECLVSGQPRRYRRRHGDATIEAVATPVTQEAGSTVRILVSAHDITDDAAQERALIAANRRLQDMATTDTLTGLPNRLLLATRLAEAIELAARAEAGVTLLYLDLDRFKPVNDLLGHAVGDALLVDVVGRLGACIRESDTLARLGGDEFAIVLPISGPAHAITVAERIRAVMSEPFSLQGQHIEIGASVGIAQYPRDAHTGAELLRCADIAMYHAKEEGNSFRLFEPRMNAELHDRRTLEQDLRRAIRAGEMELHYQPIACCATGALTGFEALLRWNHPTRGRIAPGVFIPVAEETGLIVPIGHWVLETACRQAASWPGALRIAVNLSPLQFRQRSLPEDITAIVTAAGLAPGRLELEITEGVLIDDPPRAMEILSALKAQGIRISLDDFGTGYSSLSYLRRFPFDRIKIDREFTGGLTTEPQARAIVEAVGMLARALNLAVVAEGVETAAQLQILRSRACNYVQGFLIGHPTPSATLPELIANWPKSESDAGGPGDCC